MVTKVVYMDEDNKEAVKEKAKWKIITEYNEKGDLQKEAWILLKKEVKKEELKHHGKEKCQKCS